MSRLVSMSVLIQDSISYRLTIPFHLMKTTRLFSAGQIDEDCSGLELREANVEPKVCDET